MEKQRDGFAYVGLVVIFMLSVFIDVARGDEVVLENGDRLTGKLIKVVHLQFSCKKRKHF